MNLEKVNDLAKDQAITSKAIAEALRKVANAIELRAIGPSLIDEILANLTATRILIQGELRLRLEAEDSNTRYETVKHYKERAQHWASQATASREMTYDIDTLSSSERSKLYAAVIEDMT